MGYYYSLPSWCIDISVPFEDIEFGDVVLGAGRCGACFKVKWNGAEYALKQYDTGNDGDVPFLKEISAYMLLQIVWGGLVPRPVFLFESFSGTSCFWVYNWDEYQTRTMLFQIR